VVLRCAESAPLTPDRFRHLAATELAIALATMRSSGGWAASGASAHDWFVAFAIAPRTLGPAIPFVGEHSSGRGARHGSCWAKALEGRLMSELDDLAILPRVRSADRRVPSTTGWGRGGELG
jgi:hypothetical protein